MKKLLYILIILFWAVSAFPATYYVDATSGSDSYDGLSGDVEGGGVGPWQTIGKVNGTSFSTGDDVYFLCGETWTGTMLYIDWSGTSAVAPVIIGAYYMNGASEVTTYATVKMAIESEAQSRPIIQGNATTKDYVHSWAVPSNTYNGMIQTTDQDFIVVQLLDVRRSAGYGIKSEASQNGYECDTIVIKGCDVTETARAGIFGYRGTHDSIITENEQSFCCLRYYYGRLSFNSGGTYQIQVNDSVIDPGTGQATVIAVEVTSGTWAGGNATGYLNVVWLWGTFTVAHNIRVGDDYNTATITAWAHDTDWPCGIGFNGGHWANSDDNTISYNKAHHNYGEGIGIYKHSNNATVEYNESFGSRAEFYIGNSTGSIIRYNIGYKIADTSFTDSTGIGLGDEYDKATSPFITGVRIYGNVIAGTGIGIGFWQGATGGSLSDIDVFENTTVDCGTQFRVSVQSGLTTSDFIVENNIFTDTTGTSTLAQHDASGSFAGLTYDYNLWPRDPGATWRGANDPGYSSYAAQNIALYKTTGWETLSGNDLSVSDFAPQYGSDAIGAGTTLGSPYDYMFDPSTTSPLAISDYPLVQYTGAYDIGAVTYGAGGSSTDLTRAAGIALSGVSRK